MCWFILNKQRFWNSYKETEGSILFNREICETKKGSSLNKVFQVSIFITISALKVKVVF